MCNSFWPNSSEPVHRHRSSLRKAQIAKDEVSPMENCFARSSFRRYCKPPSGHLTGCAPTIAQGHQKRTFSGTLIGTEHYILIIYI